MTNDMKKFLTIAAAIICLCSCAAFRLTPAQEAKIAEAVADSLSQRHYTIDITRIYPRRGPSRVVDGFRLKVNGDKVDSYLPFIGVAYSVDYGSQSNGMSFESTIDEYYVSTPQSDRRQIQFTTRNGNDQLMFTIIVFDNGLSDITVVSRNRETISYSGELRTPVPEK